MKRIVLMVTVALVMAAMLAVMASSAFAEANQNAACLGVVSSGLAQNPGETADVAHGIISISPEVTGEPPGAFYKIFAQRHPGGEFDC
jgi:hypothetical protein